MVVTTCQQWIWWWTNSQ